jgi:hypothetical protein
MWQFIGVSRGIMLINYNIKQHIVINKINYLVIYVKIIT